MLARGQNPKANARKRIENRARRHTSSRLMQEQVGRRKSLLPPRGAGSFKVSRILWERTVENIRWALPKPKRRRRKLCSTCFPFQIVQYRSGEIELRIPKAEINTNRDRPLEGNGASWGGRGLGRDRREKKALRSFPQIFESNRKGVAGRQYSGKSGREEGGKNGGGIRCGLQVVRISRGEEEGRNCLFVRISSTTPQENRQPLYAKGYEKQALQGEKPDSLSSIGHPYLGKQLRHCSETPKVR